MILNICTERSVKYFSEIYLPVRKSTWLIGSGGVVCFSAQCEEILMQSHSLYTGHYSTQQHTATHAIQCCIWRDLSVLYKKRSQFCHMSTSVLQCVAVSCSELQCVVACCSALYEEILILSHEYICVAVCCSELQWVAVCCSVLQCSIWRDLNSVTWFCVQYVSVYCSVFFCTEPRICATWLINICDRTHSYERQDSLLHFATKCNTLQRTATPRNTLQHAERQDSLTCATWLMYMCGMTLLYVRLGSLTCANRLIHMYVLQVQSSLLHRKPVGHDSFICPKIHTCVCIFICIYVYVYIYTHIYICTYTYI